MDYETIVEVYVALEKTTKHLEKTEIIAAFLKKIPAHELVDVVNLLQGRIFPEEEKKIGFSSKLMLKAIAKTSGLSLQKVENLWSDLGDLGIVAEKVLTKKQQATLYEKKLTAEKVIANIKKLAELEGEGTVERKVSLVQELLANASAREVRFIVRTILEELRIGVSEGILRDAIAKAFNKDVEEVEAAHNLTLDYGEVAKRAKENTLHEVKLKPGKPVKLMLSVVAADIEEAFEDLGTPAQFEFKLDGFRLQCHKEKESVKLFTRRMENVTTQFPELLPLLKENVKADSYIVDAEAVGINTKTGMYVPFQHISQRIKRKYDIEETAKKFPIELNIFDILYYNGKSVMSASMKERRAIIEKIIKPVKYKLRVTEKLISKDPKEAQRFFKEALKHGAEGVMIKNLSSSYTAGRYVGGWMKLKTTLEPLDLVIVAAEYGTGKRAGVLSSYVIACQHEGTLLECGMVSTGVKEKNEETGMTYTKLSKMLESLILKKEGRHVIVKPKIVVEVGYEEVQVSPTYASGFALRFPRFKRLRMEEKTVQDINTLTDIKRIFNMQKRK